MMKHGSGWQMRQFAMKLTTEKWIFEISTQQLDAACMGFTALLLKVWQPVPVLPFCPLGSQLIRGKLRLHKRRNRSLPAGEHVATVAAVTAHATQQIGGHSTCNLCSC